MVQVVVDYTHCVICGCKLDCDNRSDVKNVCRRCLHVLEF